MWNPVAHQHILSTTNKWGMLQKNYLLKKKKKRFCYISQWSISSSKNTAQKEDRIPFVSIYFRLQEKKASGICLAIFWKESETEDFKGSCQFSFSGWVKLNMPLHLQLENYTGMNMALLCLLWDDLKIKERQ